MPGSITVHPGSPDSFTIEMLEGQVLSIGRHPENGDSKTLVLPFPEVSGKHAEIRCKPGAWTIIDAGSTNGTTVNGIRLTPGREYVLKNADVIGIAQYQLALSMPADFLTEVDSDIDQRNTQSWINLINATILVGDIKKFSGLMEDYATNPQQVMESANKLFETLNREIQRNDGQLEKIAGDAIMAYWQSGSSKSDPSLSAYQACHTALRLKDIVEALALQEEYWPFPKHPLTLDMALATGPVASGAIGRAQGNPSLLGDTANLAFRLEKLIGDDQSGAIVVEGSTYELTKSRFHFIALGEFNVKGRQKSVNIYRLLGDSTPLIDSN